LLRVRAQFFCGDVPRLQQFVSECIKSEKWCRLAVAKQASLALPAVCRSHCLNPLPDKSGGKITSASHQELLVLLQDAALYKLLPRLSDVLLRTVPTTPDAMYLHGGLAMNYYLDAIREVKVVT
jgi:hypothetical protein